MPKIVDMIEANLKINIQVCVFSYLLENQLQYGKYDEQIKTVWPILRPTYQFPLLLKNRIH